MPFDLPIELQWDQVLRNAMLMGGAYLLALPIGVNRERMSRSAGVRTFALVSLASCSFILVVVSTVESSEARARVLSGVITGIGFIGGGAILKNEGMVRGTATAAGIWCAGAIGVAIAWHQLEVALLLSLVTFLTFTLKPRGHNSKAQRSDKS